MILDTIGFSGTHSISHILENYSKNTYVVHGSKNPFTKDKMGGNNLSEYEFLKSIKELEKELEKKIIVIHCFYPPQNIIPLCKKFKINFSLLVRNPIDQIRSCYFYGLKKILKGDKYIYNEITSNQSEKESIFNTLKINNNLANNLFIWSFQRINLYNLNAIQMGSKFYQMENLLNDISNLENLFEVEISKKFVKDFRKINKYSHKNIIENLSDKLEGFQAPDEDVLINSLTCSIRGKSASFSQIQELLGYKK